MTQRVDAPDSSALVVGYVAGAHGIHGVVRVQLHDADSESLAPDRQVILRRKGKDEGTYEVASVAPVPGKPHRRRVKLSGIRSRDDAEALKGCEVLIERDQLPDLSDDEFYLVDVIGRPVQRERDGTVQDLGTVVGLTTNGAQDLFEVQWRDPGGQARTWLLPVVPQLLSEITEQRVLVDLPLGMLPEGLEDED